MTSAPRITGEERSPLEPILMHAACAIRPPRGELGGSVTFQNWARRTRVTDVEARGWRNRRAPIMSVCATPLVWSVARF